MSLPRSRKFRNEAEKQALLQLHDELCRLTGDIDPDHAVRISQAMVEPFRKKPKPAWNGTNQKQKEPE